MTPYALGAGRARVFLSRCDAMPAGSELFDVLVALQLAARNDDFKAAEFLLSFEPWALVAELLDRISASS